MKYRAYYRANDWTIKAPIEGNNLSRLVREIRKISESERIDGNSSSWEVIEIRPTKTVAKGGMDCLGRRYRLDSRPIDGR